MSVINFTQPMPPTDPSHNITLGLNWSELQAAWEKVRDSGQFTEGYFVNALEEAVSLWCGLHAVVVCNAGCGLYSILRCLPMKNKPGAIAVPNNTFFATGAMVEEAFPNRKIVLIDCTRRDFSMSFVDLTNHDPNMIAMVVLTHIGGTLAQNYEYIADYCDRHGILLIEDAAHVLGVGKSGKTAGSRSAAAVFSLYPTKAIPVGEGGIVVTKSKHLADDIRCFRNYGKYKTGGVVKYYEGFNFRMDEWTAAVAYLQFKRYKEILSRRNDDAKKLTEIVAPMIGGDGCETNWYKYIIDHREAPWVKRVTGQVFAKSDQLKQAMQLDSNIDMPSSDYIADLHRCLPIGEGMYDGMDSHSIEQWLRG